MDNTAQASTNYREAFQLFDKRGNGRVDRSALGDLLRACGQNPTLAEIGDLERGVGNDCEFSFIRIPYTQIPPQTCKPRSATSSPRSATNSR
jgi:Ca2+-binding EF-hand superfamily protein